MAWLAEKDHGTLILPIDYPRTLLEMYPSRVSA
jgi:hypothetical protein